MENKRQFLKVKEWVIDKAQDTAMRYNVWINFQHTEKGMRKVEDGCLIVTVEEVLAETEKAVHVRLATGDIDGSFKGWKLWVPKSQIVA